MEAVACEGHRFCFFFSFFFCFHLFLFVFSSLSFPPFPFLPFLSSLSFPLLAFSLSIVLSPRQSYVAPSFIIGIAMECFRCCQGQRAILAYRGRKKQEVGSAPRRMVSDLLRSPMAGPSMLLQSLSVAFVAYFFSKSISMKIFLRISMAWSTWSLVCVAMRAKRTSVSCGAQAGGITGLMNTPAS